MYTAMRNDEFFVLMNDVRDDRSPPNRLGLLDIKKGKQCPVKDASVAFPYDVRYIEQDTIFWNFNERIALDFDYLHFDGHIMSERLFNVLSAYTSSPLKVKSVSVWMNGKEQTTTFKYLAFDQGEWRHGEQMHPSRVFYDTDHSSFEVGRLKEIIPTGRITLTNNATHYDFFELLGTVYGLHSHLILNRKVRDDLTGQDFRGIKILPLQQAFSEYCRDYNVRLSQIVPKRGRATL
ncbi:hypothetical protein VIBNIWn13_p0041 [Vibrio nigripulchritudo Wn13]|nr:hypothetical protein VIBNIAM115_p0037 [Vibrio nigripulchritudo AM115]CCN85904.1 hypothetical protein VIBNIBLFn1_p0041 [Vibrio nigripulchritudo BLFn1]CCN97701.1 hypothetical protein VIBNIENn2_p0041 [Vibrio nigripulchritudo ENn2]CCO56012.1 hypothetical protein VIBNIWn13_p0041 [Vibrio nigripulchritudo Wn13]